MKSKNIIPLSIAAIIAICIVAYVIFRFFDLVVGPSFVIENIEHGQTVTTRSYSVIIQTKRTSEIRINDTIVPQNTDGEVQHTLYLNEGLNPLSVEVIDTYGKTKKETIFVLKK